MKRRRFITALAALAPAFALPWKSQTKANSLLINDLPQQKKNDGYAFRGKTWYETNRAHRYLKYEAVANEKWTSWGFDEMKEVCYQAVRHAVDGDTPFHARTWTKTLCIKNKDQLPADYRNIDLELGLQYRFFRDVFNLAVYGDLFLELIAHNGSLVKLEMLVPSMTYRIETTKGKLVEFQQSSKGPDYKGLVGQGYEPTTVRFFPEDVEHIRLIWGHWREWGLLACRQKKFYPYGTSMLEYHNWQNNKTSWGVVLRDCVLRGYENIINRSFALKGHCFKAELI